MGSFLLQLVTKQRQHQPESGATAAGLSKAANVSTCVNQAGGFSQAQACCPQFPHLLNGSVLFVTHQDGWGLGKGRLLNSLFTKLRALKEAAEPPAAKAQKPSSAIFCCPLLNSWAFSAGLVLV